VGIRVKDGVVFGVEKLVSSKLLVEGSGKRIFHVGEHAALCVAGLAADCRQLVLRARSEASAWSGLYGTPIPVAVLAERVASYVHQFTLFASLRPFGCSVLVAGHDAAKGYQLFSVDSAGACFGYRGTAIGKAGSSARNEIEKLRLDQLTAREAVRHVARIVHSVHDEVKVRRVVD
jgi:20S proteasome subunit alpha 7